MFNNNDKNKNKKIQVTIKLFTILRKAAGKKEIILSIKDGFSVDYLLKILSKKNEKLRVELFTDNNELKQWILVLKNGRNIQYLNGLKTELEDGDIIAIFPPTAGGNMFF